MGQKIAKKDVLPEANTQPADGAIYAVNEDVWKPTVLNFPFRTSALYRIPLFTSSACIYYSDSVRYN